MRRIGWDLDLESRAFAQLTESQAGRCRESLYRLVDALSLGNLPRADARRVVHLLLDVLHRVNQTMNGEGDDRRRYHRLRLGLIDELGSCEDAEPARLRFREQLGRLLDPVRDRPPSLHPLVEHARAFIRRNYGGRLYLSSVAEQLHVSPNYLSRLFRRETGQTLTEHVQRVRLEEALRLLAQGGRRISEIAYMVGYQNYRDFYRNFVKYEKVSPREVRQRLGRSRRRAAAPDAAS